MLQVIPGLVVAPLFFAGKIELGVVSQSYSAFNHILGDLSLIVNQVRHLPLSLSSPSPSFLLLHPSPP